MNGRPKRLLSQAGFSLLELLVVVAIITILASLLLPALSRARERSHRVACLSNLRQIAIAFKLHNEEAEFRFPDRRDLKSSLPGGYRPWSTWPPSDPRSGWAVVALRPYLADSDVWSCRSARSEPFQSAVQCAQFGSSGTSSVEARYWLWRFDNRDATVPLDNFWGKNEDQVVSDLQLAAIATIGIPNGPADVELAVDPYFPQTIASVSVSLKGRAVHPGGRNRLFLDGHGEYLRDVRTPK